MLIITLLLIFQFGTVFSQDTNSENDPLDWWKSKNTPFSPSVNFEQAYTFIQQKKLKAYSTTIAVLDTDLDIEHTKILNVVWKNANEIPNDNVDNDKNGYVDDIHGWNFIASEKDKVSLDYTLMEKTRILREFTEEELDELYRNKKISFSYNEVKESYENTVNSLTEKIDLYESVEEDYTNSISILKRKFDVDSITFESLKELKPSEDLDVNKSISYVQAMKLRNFPDYNNFLDYLEFKKKSLNICMNLNYDDRALIGDNLKNSHYDNYGSQFVNKKSHKISHGTEVTGIIIEGLDELLKSEDKLLSVLPVVITAIGDPTDKDTALAIRYAADNGAKVINLSQTKTFSISDSLVDQALKYAEEKDVLIVKSAGNENLDLDISIRYPNDSNSDNKEIVDNVIVVGAIKSKINNKLKSKSSNYGKTNVDIFAPSTKIKTYTPNNGYITDSGGTSYAAPVVASVAVLIRSYFPKLSAKQVKQILMESGTSYDVEVEIILEDKSKKMIPFSELSKSGKVVNAYNALLLAEKVSKN